MDAATAMTAITAMSSNAAGPAPGLRAITSEDGQIEMFALLACLTAGWTGLFYLLSSGVRRWTAHWPESSKPHENDPYWCARNVIGIVHAVLVSLITVPGVFLLFSTSDDLRFAATGHLATCIPGPERTESIEWICLGSAIAFAGLAFTSFTLADVVISILHGLASLDFIVHHLAFISAGLIIRGHCMLPFNAAILLAMEASTPFLNYLLLIRHRGEGFKSSVQVNGILFMLLFVAFRLVLNTYGTVVLWLHRETAMPPTVPTWQAWFLLIAVTAGSAVQFFWFPFIARTFGAGLLDLLGCGGASCKANSTGLRVVSPRSSEASNESSESSAVN